MYTSFRVQNFRGFKDLELEYLARVNLIAGRNNVGKTTLLEAILTHYGNYGTVVDRTNFTISPFNPRRKKEFIDETEYFQVLFHNFDTKQPIAFAGDTSGIIVQRELPFGEHEEITTDKLEISLTNLDDLRNSNLFSPSRYLNEVDFSSVDIYGLLFKYGNREVYFMSGYGSDRRLRSMFFSRKSAFLSASSKISSKQNARRFSNLKRARRTDLLISILKIIEPRLVGLDLLENGIHGDVKGMSQLVPITSMGDGVSRIASMVLAISDTEGGILGCISS